MRAGDEIGRDVERAVALVRRDVSQARHLLAATSGLLELIDARGERVRYARSGEAGDTLVRISPGGKHPVACGVDSLEFSFEILQRPVTREEVATVLVEREVLAFEPGDWDDWVDETWCQYESRGERRVRDREWVAEEFWGQGAFTSLTRAAVRLRARDMFPTQVDLVVEVYRAATTYPYYPATLLAQGRIARASVTTSYSWLEAQLTTIQPLPIVAGADYWLVCRPAASGGATYAGHLESERIRDCLSDEWPSNGMTYRESNDAGSSWSESTSRREAFFRLHGLRPEALLTEATRTAADTLGVSYRVALRSREESAYRGGFIALQDL